jgi:tetratricopeptide (TPR) repeat protein/uncharacterized membrane protein YgcG
MKLSIQPKFRWLRIVCWSLALILTPAANHAAQPAQQTPAPAGHVNDFAGVVDEATKQQLENILENVKLKAGIEFDVVTIQSTGGQDIFDFSRQLARDWNIGALTTRKKSLLLVVAVDEKVSFTQFSKSVQNDLPEGILGEMGQRMRALVAVGQFGQALNAAVQHFVGALAEKLAISADDFEKSPAAAPAANPTSADNSTSKPTEEVAATVTELEKAEVVSVTPAPVASRRSGAVAKKKPVASVDDAGEAEEVELTLTRPVAERVDLLKAFLEEHPESGSKTRAMELLVAARAATGDELLQQGDPAGGIAQLLLAITDAPVDASEQLFSGVISQVPLNLYLRGEPAAANQAAQKIEARFGNDPKRLVVLSGYYVNTEQGAEATRLATQAVQLSPELAAAHQGLGRALHVSLRLEEAAAEYKRALELDPNSRAARRGLADLDRAFGKSEEALELYRQQLEVEPADKAARSGLVLSLFDLGRAEEGKTELEKALTADPRNLPLLAGAAYWFAAHNQSDIALPLAAKAVAVEPRYTWAQIALARALVAQKKPLEAERALRFARQYGKFSTLDYELASVLAAAGLYDEAAELLVQSFTIKDGQLETRLGGQAMARASNFIDLLAPERRASIFQSVSADTENNAKLLKALLTFALLTSTEPDAGPIDAERATQAANEFAAGDDPARVYRQLFAAGRMLQRGFGYQTAYELAEAARSSADAGMSVPALTLAVQAEEFRSIRARAIAAGGTPDIPEAPRNVLSNLLRGRIEDTSGWALLNQDKPDEAVEHLRRAVAILPEGTPAARTSLWHLGAALDRQDKQAEALSYYIKSYNAGEPDQVRRIMIEQRYRKLNGSLDGLDQRIGAATTAASEPEPTPGSREQTNELAAAATSSPNPTPATTTEAVPDASLTPAATPIESPAATPEPSPVPEAPSASVPPAEATPEPTPQGTTESSPVLPTAEPAPSPTPDSANSSAATTPALDSSPVAKMDKPPRTTVAITGRVKDAAGNPIASVVVVLISPQGTVLAATTDEQGNYSFTVAPSAAPHSYRIIPSREGLTFEPVDRTLPVVNDDVRELDFVGHPAASPESP